MRRFMVMTCAAILGAALASAGAPAARAAAAMQGLAAAQLKHVVKEPLTYVCGGEEMPWPGAPGWYRDCSPGPEWRRGHRYGWGQWPVPRPFLTGPYRYSFGFTPYYGPDFYYGAYAARPCGFGPCPEPPPCGAGGCPQPPAYVPYK